VPKPEFVYVTYIETTLEKLWDALTKSEFSRDGISKGWPAILSSLKSLLESGTALAIPPAALSIEGFA
jgi:hypothetical protein